MKHTNEILQELDKRIKELSDKLQEELQKGIKHDKELCQVWAEQIDIYKDFKHWILK